MGKQPQTELIELLHTTLLPSFPNITIGPMPSNGSTCLQITGGAKDSQYFDRKQLRYLTILFLTKHKAQETAFTNCVAIANFLNTLYHLPQPQKSQWVKTEIVTGPQAVDVVNGEYFYSCVAHLYYYL